MGRESKRVKHNKYHQDRRALFKRTLVELNGGKCTVCGYDRCLKALEFHHVDPKKKNFAITDFIRDHKSLDHFDTVLKESELCVLVCRNCHTEIHDGLIEINGKKLKRKRGRKLR